MDKRERTKYFDKTFLVKVNKLGDVYIDGKHVAQLCFNANSVGMAIANYLVGEADEDKLHNAFTAKMAAKTIDQIRKDTEKLCGCADHVSYSLGDDSTANLIDRISSSIHKKCTKLLANLK